jgi:hypothetical protein
MYQKPTVPRPIGGVLDDTLQLFKASMPYCWLPSLLTGLVGAVLSYYITRAMPVTASPIAPAELWARYRTLFGTFGIWYLLVIAVDLVLYALLIVNVAAVSRGESPTFGDSLARAARRAPALFAASLLFAIAIVIGLVLLIIPGLYVWNRLQLYIVPVVAETQGPGESLAGSWSLVGGNWWRTAAVVSVIFVILIVLELVVGVLVGILAGIGGGAVTSAAELAVRTSLISIVAGTLVNIITLPLVIAAFVALYQDLLLRKGGGDLEARLGALPKG